MEAVDITRLEEAVVAFYSSTTSDQAVTHDWLTKVQSSPQAWQFSWQLLQLGKKQEVQFFGAVTLHSKLLKYWHEVPAEHRHELKSKLLEYIIQFSAGPKIILNRLCIAMSAFIVHMLEEWPAAIEDVIKTIQALTLPEEIKLWIMLEILQAIPEEMQAVTTSVKRAILRAKVDENARLVMDTSESYLRMQLQRETWDSDVFSNMTRAVNCVNSWVKNIGFLIQYCQNLVEILLQIVNRCYWPCQRHPEVDGCMTSDENELAETCLKTLLTIIIQPMNDLYPKSVILFIKMFLDSLTGITKMEWKPENGNEDIAVHIYSLFISSVERHSRILLNGILTGDPELMSMYSRLVQEVIQCTDKPGIYPVDESCSNMSLGFWYLLQDEVFSFNDKKDRDKCWEAIKPVYIHLTRILVKKAQQPDIDDLGKWSSDDLESFRCYRQDISDTFMYCYEVLHDLTLDILAGILDEVIAQMQVNPNNWTMLEASIFSFQSVAEQFGKDENQQIPKFMTLLGTIPYEKMPDKLLGTALETVGAYCQWFKDNPSFLPNAIELLVRGLSSSRTAQATMGLKEICRDCQVQLKPYAAPLLNACQAALDSGRLKDSEAVRLMYSVGKLMSVLPPEAIPQYLDVIVSPCFEALQSICQSKDTSNAARTSTIFRLQMISLLFSSLNTDLDEDQVQNLSTTQPVLLVMEKTMPIFRQVAEMWINEIDVIETCCSALRHALVNLRYLFQPMLQELCIFVVGILQNKFCAPVLGLSKSAIVIFYNEPMCKDIMSELMVQFAIHSFRYFETIPDDGFSNISDVIEQFYSSLTQIVKKIPQILENDNIAQDRLIFYALKAIVLPENGPIRNGVQFLTHFILQSRKYTTMTKTMHSFGQNIVLTIVACVAYAAPRQQVEKYADVLMALNKQYPSQHPIWLKHAVKNIALPPMTSANDNDLTQFCSLVIKERVNKRLLQQHLSKFAIKARGLSDKFH